MKKHLSFILLLALMLSIASQGFAVYQYVGNGSSSANHIPVKAIDSYGYTQQIYDREWINRSGEINSIRFFFQSGNRYNNTKNWTIYLGHTTKSEYAGVYDWVEHSSLTQVFSGDVSSFYPSPGSWMTISFDTSFYYNNVDNLVLAVLESTPGYNAAGLNWGAFDTPGYKSIGYYNDSSCPNPNNNLPGAHNVNRICNHIGLNFWDRPHPPILNSPSTGALVTNAVTLKWSPAGGSPAATGYDVYIDGNLVSNNQSSTSYTATGLSLGYHTWYVVARNSEGASDQSFTRSFYVIDGKIVGSGTAAQVYPFNSLWGYGRSLGLYYWGEVGRYGCITDLGWSVEVPSDAAIPYKIYIKDGASSSMSSMTWDQFTTGATLVKQGTYTFDRDGWHIFELDTPFHYHSGELLIGVETNYTGSGSGTEFSEYPQFHYTNTTSNSHQYWRRDHYEPAGSGMVDARRPNLYLVKVKDNDTFPYNEGFESEQVHQTSVKGWVQRGGYSRFWEANTNTMYYNMAPRNGTYNATLRYGGNKWLIKPFNLISGRWYEVSLWARQDGNDATDASVGIYWGDSPKVSSMTNVIKAQTGVVNGGYQEIKGRFMAQSSGFCWIGIRGQINFVPWYLSMDDIKIEETHPCIVDVDMGNSYNPSNENPAVYGGWYANAREQYIVTASELISKGVKAGYIDYLAFMVQNTNNCGALPNFTISMRSTYSSSFSNTTFFTGLTEVYYRPSYTPTAGTNNHFLHTPFYWNGTSNLVIQVSFDLRNYYTANTSTRYTTTSAYRAMYYRSDGTAWNTVSTGTRSYNRPDIRFRFACPIEGPPLSPHIFLTSPANGSVQSQDGFKLVWEPQLYTGGLADSYTVYISTDASNVFGQRSWTVTSGSFNPVTQGGMNLAYGVRYYWAVRATNSYGTSGAGAWYFDVESYPAVTSYPYTENFDSTPIGEVPAGWNNVYTSHLGADARPWETSAGYDPISEPYCARVNYHTEYPKDAWLMSLPFQMLGGQPYSISFRVRAPGWEMPEALKLCCGTGPTKVHMNNGWTLYNNNQMFLSGWTEINTSFTPPATGTYYFGWHAYSQADVFYIAIDDVTIDVTTALAAPVVSVTRSGSNLVLSWDPVPGATGYKVYSSADPYNFGPTPVATVSTTTYTVAASLVKRFFRVTSYNSREASADEVGLSEKSSAIIENTDERKDIKEKSSNIKRP